MPKITRSADTVYHGRDQGQRLTIHPGAAVEVSDEKAKQLLRDFPDDFKKGGRRNTGNAPKTPESVPADDTPYAERELDALRGEAAARDLETTEETTHEELVAALEADDKARQ